MVEIAFVIGLAKVQSLNLALQKVGLVHFLPEGIQAEKRTERQINELRQHE